MYNLIESGQVEYEYEDVSVVENVDDYYEDTDYVEKEYVYEYEYEETHLKICWSKKRYQIY